MGTEPKTRLRVRETEPRRAAAALAAEVGFLCFEDGRVTNTLENRRQVLEAIRAHAPDLLLTHYEDVMHPDHRATSRLVTDAYYMASLPLVDTDDEPVDSQNVYHFGKESAAFEPTTFVDVPGFVDTKVAAIQWHESQVELLKAHGGIDAEFDNLVEDIRVRARTLGRRVGSTAVEGFYPLHETSTAYLD